MPREKDDEYNKLEGELQALKAETKKAKDSAGSQAERDELQAETDKVAKQVKGKEIKGMSESSAHSLLEEIRALRSEMADRFNLGGGAPVIKKPDGSAPTEEKESGFSLSSLFWD